MQDLELMKAAVTLEGVLPGTSALELFAEVEALTAENTRIFAMVDAREQTIAELTALCDEYRGGIERLKVDCECHRIQAVDRGNSYQKAAAEIERLNGELQSYRDEETCMCGSPIKTHTMGDGHSPASVLDYRLGQLVKGEQEMESALTRARAEGMEEGSRTMRTMAANAMRRYHNGLRGEIPATVIMSLPLVTEAAKGEQ